VSSPSQILPVISPFCRCFSFYRPYLFFAHYFSNVTVRIICQHCGTPTVLVKGQEQVGYTTKACLFDFTRKIVGNTSLCQKPNRMKWNDSGMGGNETGDRHLLRIYFSHLPAFPRTPLVFVNMTLCHAMAIVDYEGGSLIIVLYLPSVSARDGIRNCDTPMGQAVCFSKLT
jgi:hypothetical protein